MDTEQGMVTVELQYHIGDDVARLETSVVADQYEIVEADGFDRVDGGYEFTVSGPDDEQTWSTTTSRVTFTPEIAGSYTVSVAVTATGTVDVLEAATSNTGDSTNDDTSGTDGTTETGGETDSDTESTGESPGDGFGDGLRPAVVAVALVELALLARYRN